MHTNSIRDGLFAKTLILIASFAGLGLLTPSLARCEDPSDPASQPTTQPTTQPADVEVDPTIVSPPPLVPVKTTNEDEIQSLLKQVEQSTVLEEAKKNEALSALREAKAKLEQKKTWNERADSFKDRIDKAPQELKELRQLDPTTQPVTTQPTTAETASLEELEVQLRAEQAKLDVNATRMKNAEEALVRRGTFLAEGPKEIGKTRDELVQLGTDPVKQDGPELVVEAIKCKRAATRMMLEQRLAALELESRFYELHGELLLFERDRAVQRRDALEASIKQLRSRVAALRQQAAEQAKEKAEDVNSRVRRLFPEIDELIKENKRLGEDLVQVSQKLAELATVDQSIETDLKRVQEEFKDAKEQESTARVSQSFGILLRSQLGTLPDTGVFRRRRANRQAEIELANFEQSSYQARRNKLANPERIIEEWAERIPPGLSESDRTLVIDEVRRQIGLSKENLEKLYLDYPKYISELNELSNVLTTLIQTTEEFKAFIDERILWVRSGQYIGADGFKGLTAAVQWLFDAEHWGAFLNAAADHYAKNWYLIIPALIVVGLLIGIRRSVRKRLRELAAQASEPLSTDYSVTLSTCFYTLLLAIPYPLLLYFLGQLFSRVPDSGDFAKAVAGGFNSAALTAFPLLLLIHVCRVQGLAGAHLGWDSKSIGILRRNLIWYVGASIPVGFVVGMLSSQGDEAHRETFGRDVFILGMIFLTVFIARVFKPRSGALTHYMIQHPQGRLVRFRYVLYAFFLLIPIVIATGAGFGYYYTALRMASRCWLTAIIWASAMIIYLLLMRWLLLARRRIAIDQAMRKRAEAKAKAEAKAEAARVANRDSDDGAHSDDAPVKAAPIEEPMINIPTLSQQTRQLIGSLTIFTVVTLTFWVWVSELPALGILRNVEIGELDITAADIGLALIAAIVSTIAIRNIPAMLEIFVLSHLPIDAGTRYAVTAISRYLIGTLGIIITFGLLGIGWSKVQWLVAAVSVGLGFGLQEIFANFVSGLIILFERPIRIGDTVTVGSQTGTVSKIRIRATSITDWDNKELVVPNKRFVTDEITNWTLSNQILRLVIPVGVSYSSNPRQVRDVLMDVIKANGKSMDDPPPRVYFLGFGDSALNFECRAFFKNFDDMMTGRHQLYTEIFEACKREKIEIAFPQRDIHIRSINAVLPVQQGSGDPKELKAERDETQA